MIRHIVLFSAKDSAEVPTIHAALSRLKEIPHARLLEVALNERHDQLSQEIDIVVHGEFDDLAQLERWKAHPLYQEAIVAVRPRRELRLAADYEVPG
jgi:hypothetical protein